MPSYNEEDYVEKCFKKVYSVMKIIGQPFEIILEEEGSTDSTPKIIDKLAAKYPFVKALHFHKRMGKGWGIRRCFREAKGDIIVLIDSDLEYPPEKIPEFIKALDKADIIVGHRKTWLNIKKKLVRRIASIIYVNLVHYLFQVHNFEDIQTGFKAFKRDVIENISPLTSNGFEIDTEILIKASKRGYEIAYVPITYTYKGTSEVKMWKDSLKMLRSILKWKYFT